MLLTMEELISMMKMLQDELDELSSKQLLIKDASGLLDKEIKDVEKSINNLHNEFVSRRTK